MCVRLQGVCIRTLSPTRYRFPARDKNITEVYIYVQNIMQNIIT